MICFKSCISMPQKIRCLFFGSVPDGVSDEFYELAIKMVHQKGAKVFLDADRMLLKRGLKAKPDFLKVNQKELETRVAKRYRMQKKQRFWDCSCWMKEWDL